MLSTQFPRVHHVFATEYNMLKLTFINPSEFPLNNRSLSLHDILLSNVNKKFSS